MATQLTAPWAVTPSVVCDFGWYAPGGSLFNAYSYTVNAIGYPPNNFTWTVNGTVYTTSYQSYVVPLGQPVVFDALDSFVLGIPKVITPTGISVVEYLWDLGNGTTGSGPSISTTYNLTVQAPDQTVKLTTIDSLGREVTTSHPIELKGLTLVDGTMSRQMQGPSRT